MLTLYNFIVIFATSAVAFVTYVLWSFKYWTNRNVPHDPPKFPYGNTQAPLTRKNHLFQQLLKPYNKYKEQEKRYFGFYFFTKPLFVIIDPELIKSVMAKDFVHFMDRGFYSNEKADPLSAHLFSIGGTKWRNLRTKFTPTFTSGKMKMMLQILLECGEQLNLALDHTQKENGAVDIKECLACFTTDVIGSCAFGLEFNSFKEKDSSFRKYGKKVFSSSKFRVMRQFFNTIFPNLARLIGSRAFPRDISDFFFNTVKETVDYREKHNYTRNDFMQILIDLKNKKKIDEGETNEHNGKTLTVEEIAAQAFIFFLAGFETSSTAMTFSIYEMCMNENIQNKLREEVNAVLKKHNGNFTYEALSDMKYMEQILDESMRKYPPVPVLNRRCTKEYKVPNSDLVLEKNTSILIPVYSIHHDPEYFPDPEKFDPDRFNEENKPKIYPYTYMPFGEGPRICIGLRFGMMQAKVGLAILLKNFKFKMHPKTKLPIVIDPNIFILQTVNTLYLDCERISN